MKRVKRYRQKLKNAVNLHAITEAIMNTNTTVETPRFARRATDSAFVERLAEIRAKYGTLSAYLNDEKPLKRDSRAPRVIKPKARKLAPC